MATSKGTAKTTENIPAPKPVVHKKRAKVIAVWTMKGGSGKTTLSFHLAQGLALSGYYVILIDNDPQLTLSTKCCNIKPDLPGMDQVYRGTASLKDCVYIDDSININEEKTLAVVPGSRHFADCLEQKYKGNFDFSNLAKGLADEDIRGAVDYIIIDNNPAFEGPSQAAIEACDEIFLCGFPTTFDFDGLMRGHSRIKELGPEVAKKVTHIIPTAVLNTNLQKNYLQVMRKVYGDMVTKNVCIATAMVPEAIDKNKIVYLYKYTSDYSQQMLSLISELFPEITKENTTLQIKSIAKQKRLESLMEGIRKRREEKDKLDELAKNYTGASENVEDEGAEVSHGQ